jgi:pimeloyl-ACP methyl ester carboxylesterase
MPLLAARHAVTALDLRGFGDSEKPLSGYDVATLCADLDALLRQLNVRAVRLVGHDIGGLVAYAFARLHPDRVERLALADAPLPLLGVQAAFWPLVERQLWHQAFFRVPDIPEALIAGRERMFLGWFLTHNAYDPSVFGPADIDEYVRCYSAPGALRASFGFGRARDQSLEQVQRASAAKLKMPILMLGGETTLRDTLVDPLRQVAEDVRGAVVPRSGHWMPEENPAFVAEQLLAFFGAGD